jgi:hypothetical protein
MRERMVESGREEGEIGWQRRWGMEGGRGWQIRVQRMADRSSEDGG